MVLLGWMDGWMDDLVLLDLLHLYLYLYCTVSTFINHSDLPASPFPSGMLTKEGDMNENFFIFTIASCLLFSLAE